MNLEKILMIIMVVVAIVGAFIEIPMMLLILLALGLVAGVMNPVADIQERTVYLLIAFAAPTVANSLDVIPAVGVYLNSIIDHIAFAAGGMWIGNFVIAVFNRVKP